MADQSAPRLFTRPVPPLDPPISPADPLAGSDRFWGQEVISACLSDSELLEAVRTRTRMRIFLDARAGEALDELAERHGAGPASWSERNPRGKGSSPTTPGDPSGAQ